MHINITKGAVAATLIASIASGGVGFYVGNAVVEPDTVPSITAPVAPKQESRLNAEEAEWADKYMVEVDDVPALRVQFGNSTAGDVTRGTTFQLVIPEAGEQEAEFYAGVVLVDGAPAAGVWSVVDGLPVAMNNAAAALAGTRFTPDAEQAKQVDLMVRVVEDRAPEFNN